MLALVDVNHNKFNFGKRLYCNGVVPCTPQKNENVNTDFSPKQVQSQPTENENGPEVSVTITSPGQQGASQSQTSPGLSMPILMPSALSPMSPNTFTQNYSETPDLAYLQLSNNDLVRRNSLSLRTPPHGSIADEILNSENVDKHYSQAKNILSNLREISERFSDFASCESLTDDSDKETTKSNADGFQKQGRRHKRKKDKLSPSPPKDYFLKKQNTNCSPDIGRSSSQKS